MFCIHSYEYAVNIFYFFISNLLSILINDETRKKWLIVHLLLGIYKYYKYFCWFNFSGGADDFDEVEDDADLDELDQAEVIFLFLCRFIVPTI